MREITKDEHSLFLQTLDYLEENYRYFKDGNSITIHGDFTNPNSPQIDSLSIIFPSEDGAYDIDFDQFIKLAPEILSIEVIDKSVIRTKNSSYYLVSPNDNYYEYILRNYYDLRIVSEVGVELDLVFNSLIIGLAATELDEHDEDFWGTYSPYMSIKVTYSDGGKVLSPEQEVAMVSAYIFEVADITGIALKFSEISVPFYDYEDYDEEEEYLDLAAKDRRYLQPYNEGMRLFVSAIQIQEAELKFLNFYKILEHFAPVVVNIEAHELMRNKLNVASSNFNDGDYLKSIFDLSKSIRSRFNDEELIKSTFGVCFNLIEHFEELPETIKLKVLQAIGQKQLTVSTEAVKIKIASNMVGKIIYNTRNKVVHAKSNFRASENICEGSELGDLNTFMKEICSKTIRWYNKLPQHQKLAIIN